MALIDKAITGAAYAFLDGKNVVDGSTISTNATLIDPIVSGTNNSYYLAPAGSQSISLTIPNLNTMPEATIVVYPFFTTTSSSTVALIGGSNFLVYNSAGYLTVTLPYSTPITKNFDFSSSSASQIAVTMTKRAWSVFLNGELAGQGSVNNVGLASATTMSFSSEASKEFALGAALIYPYVLTQETLVEQMIEAFSGGYDAISYADGGHYNISESIQDFAASESVPALTQWGEFPLQNIRVSASGAGLDLQYPEQYSSLYNSYYVSSLSDLIQPGSGMVKFRIPSYATGGVRGLLYLKSKSGGVDEFAIELTATNRVQAYRKSFTVDSNGLETSAWAAYGALGPTVSAGTSLSWGFGWTANSFFLMDNATQLSTISDFYFSPFDYEVWLGVDRNLANPYYASQAAWTMEFRAYNFVETVSSNTSYGTHTFISSSALTEAMPIRAEGKIDLQLLIDGKTRVPYYYIDGSPSTVQETLLT